MPKDWQRNRFALLADKINGIEHDELIIAGDLLDSADPTIEEIGLLYDFLAAIDTPIILIPGNHELVNKKDDCYLYIERMLSDLGVRVIRTFHSENNIDYIPYNILHAKEWPEASNRIAVTHVRGEIPPHVLPEIDLNKFSKYKLVFAGDLHAKSNSQGNLLYPGSPMTTSFHRTESAGENGAYLINPDSCLYQWIDLELPQLLRKRVTSEAEMKPTAPHHTVYELEGTLEDLAKIKSSELLDKKVTQEIGSPASLNMNGDIVDELVEYLVEVKKVDNIKDIVSVFREVVIDNA